MGITSSVGLISGINFAELIDQLLAIDARPRNLVTNRNTVLQSQAAAFQTINAKLLAFKLSSAKLTQNSSFTPTKAVSSNESVLTATSSAASVPGTYSFRVHRLVSGQQTITRGFADADASPVAPNGGTLTFESARARLDTDTVLSQLNGGDGIQRGFIRITDRSGASALIDLSAVYTVQDVLDKINNATGVNVTAGVSGDALTLTDNTGQSASNLVIQDVGASATATTLGLAANVAAASHTGENVNRIGDSTLLSSLNDGNGVHNRNGIAEFRIRVADGSTIDIDLDGVATVGQLIDKINAVADGKVTAQVNPAGHGLSLTDETAGGTPFEVVALNDSSAAGDLGILAAAAGDTINGSRLIAAINSKLLANLNGGTGATMGEIQITNRAGATTNVDLSGTQSISEVIQRINAAGAGVTASLNQAGNGLRLTDTTGQNASDLIISDLSGSAAADLKLEGTHSGNIADSGNLQYRYVTMSTRLDALNITRGLFTITDSNGVSGTVDLTQGDEVTMADVLAEINSRGLAINARLNDTGDGIVLEDTGAGVVAMKVEEAGSTTARDLGILGEASEAGESINGSFEKTIEVTADMTLTQLVTAIKDANVGVNASVINDGSGGVPYRLSLTSKDSGRHAGFVFDDGGLGFNAATLSKASDALVFYGSSNPATAVAITSPTNSLSTVIPGTTISLNATSDTAVQLSIGRDNDKIITDVNDMVTKFNDVISTIDQYDKYDSENEEKGLLLGDPTTASLRSSLFRIAVNRNGSLTGQYSALSQIGITVASGGKALAFDETKFRAALEANPQAVQQLFALHEKDDEGNTIASGIGVAMDQLLARLTDADTGMLQSRMDALQSQIALNTRRIDQLNAALEAKRERYTAQFIAMERALANMQNQSQALAGFQPLQINQNSGSRNNQ